MNNDPEKIVRCDRCGYTNSLRCFKAAMSVYNDIACPECGSTNNEHNAWVQSQMFEKNLDDKLHETQQEAEMSRNKSEIIRWPVGTLCHTRDGRQCGNGIVIEVIPASVPGPQPTLFVVETDFGNKIERLNSK